MDKLEKYIRDNRRKLDVESPPEKVWKEIRDHGFQPGIKKDFNWMWKAAAIVFFTASLGLLYLLVSPSDNEPRYSLGDISGEYAQLESNYQSSIKAISASIDFKQLDENELGWLLKELQYLEEVNEQFRKDIPEEVDKEKLVRVLIDYYEKKIKILKKIELEINRMHNEKNSDISI